MKVGLCDLHAVCVSVNPPLPPPINFWMPQPIFMKLGMYIMATEPISEAYFINPSHRSVCLYVYPSYRCSVKMFPLQRRIVGDVVFCWIRVVSKEGRRLVFPRTSCSDIIFPSPFRQSFTGSVPTRNAPFLCFLFYYGRYVRCPI
jgi:hypothetical protein